MRDNKYRRFVNLLDSERYSIKSCGNDVEDELRLSLKTILGQQQERNFPHGAMVEHHPISSKEKSRLNPFREKVLAVISLGYVMMAGPIWKGDIVVADIEELDNSNASEIHARRLNAKEVVTPKRCDFFKFLIADGTAKMSGGELSIPRTHFEAGPTCEE